MGFVDKTVCLSVKNLKPGEIYRIIRILIQANIFRMKGGYAVDSSKIQGAVCSLVVGEGVEFFVGNAVFRQKNLYRMVGLVKTHQTIIARQPNSIIIVFINGIERVV